MAHSRKENTVVQNPTLEQAVECIRSSTPLFKKTTPFQTSIWRPRPKDPFIYVSFSLTQLKKTYGTDPIFKEYIKKRKLKEFPLPIIQKLRQILVEEFIEKSKLPIQFLSENISSDDISEKNVCFILIDKNIGPNQEGDTYNPGLTLSITSDLTFQLQGRMGHFYAEYKIILVAHKEENVLSNHQIYTFMHESLHAFIEAKHPLPYKNTDEGPFCQLDCQHTTMVYDQDCESVNTRYRELLLSYSPEERTLLEDDIFMLAQEAFPTTLQTVDILASEDFKLSWELRNEKEQKQEEESKTNNCVQDEYNRQNASQSLSSSTLQINDSEYGIIEPELHESSAASFFSSPLSWFCKKIVSGYDYMLDCAQDYATDVVTTCPSYFAKNDVTKTKLWRQEQATYFPSFFTSNQNVERLCIAAPSTLKLCK